MTQQRLIPVEKFISNQLAELIIGKSFLTALFATYKEVYGYKSGLVKTEKTGLKVIVRNGHMAFDSSAVAGLWIGASFSFRDPEARAIGVAAVASERSRAKAAQQRVENQLGLEKDGNVLAVVYAGLSAFEEAVDFATHLKQGSSQVTAVVLTCDCNLSRKERQLLSLMEAGQIDHGIFTRECGGFGTMKNILEKLVSIWPN